MVPSRPPGRASCSNTPGPCCGPSCLGGGRCTCWTRSRWVQSGQTTCAVELYFEDRWYNVWHFRDDTTDPLWFKVLWYCNVALPASFDGETLRWVDLDIDIRCYRDGAPEVLDEDEFEQHRVELGYPAEVVERALAARDEVLRLAQERVFPFDYETQISALRR